MDVKDIQVANKTKCANGANNEDWCEAWLRGGFSIRYLNAFKCALQISSSRCARDAVRAKARWQASRDTRRW